MVAVEITPQMRNIADQIASKWSIPGDLHECDHLLRYIVKKRGVEVGTHNYFTGGRSDAAKVVSALERLRFEKHSLRILDFAAGYGRVARHAKPALAGHNLFAADIHPAACDFVQDKFDIPTFRSAGDPAHLNVGGNYDFVYVLSLFSHLPDKTFGQWLTALTDIVAPGGYMLFTANGEKKLADLRDFFSEVYDPAQGFGYRTNSDQLDLDSEEYGTMVVSSLYVVERLKQYAPRTRLHSFRSGAWFGNQDEWIVQKLG